MAVLQNRGFETQGSGPGLPASWTLVVLGTAAYDIAMFSTGSYGAEGFGEGWNNDSYLFAFQESDITSFSLTTLLLGTDKLVEDFEELWLNVQNFRWTMDGDSQAILETFNTGWGNTNFQTFDDVASSEGILESFDSGWGTVLLTVFDTLAHSEAAFGNDFNGETFEDVWGPRDFVVSDLLSSTLYSFWHGLVVGDRIGFTAGPTGALPAGIQEDTLYHVLTVPDVATFTISINGADLLDVVSLGTGANRMYKNRLIFWDQLLTGL